jgi:hypothetical protein
MIAMDKKQLERALNHELSKYGFSKRGPTWYRESNETIQVVDLQKSTYGAQFFVNLGCAPKAMKLEGMPKPKEHKCPIRIRLTGAFPEERSWLEKVFDLDNEETGDAERVANIAVVVERQIAAFLKHFESAATLRCAVVQGILRKGMVTGAVKEFLGITGNEGRGSDAGESDMTVTKR